MESNNNEKPQKIGFLSLEELNILENYQFPTCSLKAAADLFLFQCYTGFSYSELASFDVKVDTYVHIQDNGEILVFTDKNCILGDATLLSKKALSILGQNHNELPILSKQQYNKNLKEIALLLKFEKPLTSHVGHKTAAFMCKNTEIDTENLTF